MDWRHIDEPLFARIVDAILDRIYGDRGYAPEGRGGDQGIDYSVDNNKLIYQYKFYPDGANTASRRRQIKKSFVDAMVHRPAEWDVVIPAKILPILRKYILDLRSVVDHDVKIRIRDQAWMDNQLIDKSDLAEYFMYRTEMDYLAAKSELLKVNPLVRSPDDVANKLAALQGAIDASDPDWTLDISTVNGVLTQTLRGKHANAATRSPIEISYTAVFPEIGGQRERLEINLDYGVVEPVHLAGSMVRDFKITGPEIVRYEGAVGALELLPDPESVSPWAVTDLKVMDAESVVVGTHLCRSRLAGQGLKGVTIEVELDGLVTMLFRCPGTESDKGRVDITSEDLTGHPIRDAIAASELMTQLASPGALLGLHINGSRLLGVSLNAAVGADWLPAFEEVKAIANDLAVIERETKARFRLPKEVSALDRVDIRNVRLMFEGHVVAHPTRNEIQVVLQGDGGPNLKSLLANESGWVQCHLSPAHLKVLGEDIEIEQLSVGGMVRPRIVDVAAIRAGLVAGSVDDLPLALQLDRDDRLRMWMPIRFHGDALWITPWNIPGIEQPAGTVSAIAPDAERIEGPEKKHGD